MAKAEHLEKGENPRFVVTSLNREAWPAQELYEQHYCARGDMENRIKEQLMLFSDRTSTHYLRSNQLRLYFSSIAYVLLQMLRRLGLEGTELAKAQCSTIRLKLLKICALIRITVRKVWISLAVLEKLAEIKMIDAWIPTVDQRWLILPRYTQPSPDTKLLIDEAEIAVAEPAATASGSAKTELRNRGTNGPVGGYLVVKTFP